MKITPFKAIVSAVVIIVLGVFFFYQNRTKESAAPTEVACTLEAKICPDGSSVGRTGPACEFAACPASATTAPTTSATVKGQGTLKGTMSIGPVCPVETVTNPCKPTPEMYAAAKVFVYKADKKTLVKTVIPGAQGTFSTSLPAGDYFIDMIHQRIGGTTGVPITVTIVADQTVTLTLHVDTGLR